MADISEKDLMNIKNLMILDLMEVSNEQELAKVYPDIWNTWDTLVPESGVPVEWLEKVFSDQEKDIIDEYNSVWHQLSEDPDLYPCDFEDFVKTDAWKILSSTANKALDVLRNQK